MAGRKLYLYGLGSGLIIGALVLQLASIGQTAEQRTDLSAVIQSLTVAELKNAVEANGFRLVQANETLYSAKEVEAKIAQAIEEERGNAGTSANKIYAFTIASGTNLSTISRLLYELGLIDDPNHFVTIMEERQLADKVQAKYYRFDSVPTLEELIEKLTSR